MCEDNKCTILHRAVQTKNTRAVQLILNDTRINPNTTDDYGLQAFHYALEDESDINLEILRLFLEDERTETSAPGRNGHLPIQNAVYKNHTEIFNLLVEFDVNLCVLDNNGKHLILHAIKHDNLDLFYTLLNNTCEGFCEEHLNNSAPLHYAIYENRIDMLEILLHHERININAADKKGRHILHYAAYLNKLEAVQLLLDNDLIDSCGLSVNRNQTMRYAILNCSIDVLKYLLADEQVALFNVDEDVDESERYILHYAVRKNNADAIRILLLHIDPNVMFGDSNSHAIHLAVRKGCFNALLALLDDSRIDINIKDKNGMSCYDIAKKFRKKKNMQKIFNHLDKIRTHDIQKTLIPLECPREFSVESIDYVAYDNIISNEMIICRNELGILSIEPMPKFRYHYLTEDYIDIIG